MSQVLRLAIAAVETGKSAEQPGVSLRRHDRVLLCKGCGIEGGIGPAPLLHIAGQHRDLEAFRHVDPGVLQQRHQIVGGGAHHRVLKIQQADALDTFSLRQPDQVGRVKVAQHPGLRRICELGEQIVPDQQEVGLHVAGQGHALVRQVPFLHQPDLDHHCLVVERRHRVVEMRCERQHIGQRLPMECSQHVHRGLIAIGDRFGRIAGDESLAAEILGDKETFIEIGVVNRGCGIAALAQSAGDGDKRPDIFGEVHSLAVGFSVIERRSVGATRRIHQDGGLVVLGQPRVRARRGITRHTLTLRIETACKFEKLA